MSNDKINFFACGNLNKGDAILMLSQNYAKQIEICKNANSCVHNVPIECFNIQNGACPLCRRYYELKIDYDILKIEWSMILDIFPDLREKYKSNL